MKKLAIVFIVFLIILNGVQTKKFTLLDYFSGDYTAYTSLNKSSNATNLGFCYMYTTPNVDNIIGESIIVENLEVESAINSLKARVVKTEYLDDGTTVIYAYSSLIDEKVEVSEGYVNLQLAIKNDRTVIGWPLILGSF